MFAPADRNKIYRTAVTLGVLTFMLIVWGGHVNTTRSGMAFPDWPTSNYAPMVTYAPSEWLWQGDRFWEHGHRLFASLVGMVTTLLVFFAYRATPKGERPTSVIIGFVGLVFVIVASAITGFNHMPTGVMEAFMVALAAAFAGFLVKAARIRGDARILWLSLAAFAGVCLQGAFGGYTVRNNLPDWTSTTHGMLAEIFLMTVIGVAYLVSQQRAASSEPRATNHEQRATNHRLIASLTWGMTFIQFFLGALTRHTDSWGVSVSFPQWSDEGFFPGADLMQHGQVLIHLVHRTTAYLVALAVIIQWWMFRRSSSPTMTRVTSTGAVLVLVQILLGASILWTARGEIVTTLHVMVGVALLALNTIVFYAANGGTSTAKETVIAAPAVGRGGQS